MSFPSDIYFVVTLLIYFFNEQKGNEQENEIK